MKNSKRKEYIEKVKSEFFHSLIRVILPFILTSLALIIISKYNEIIHFIDKGDFCIYCVALFSTSFYLFGENKEHITKIFDQRLSDSVIWFMIISAVVYGYMYLIENINFMMFIKINIWFVRILSILLFCISLISLYRAILIHRQDMFPRVDVIEEGQKQVDGIKENL